MKTYKETVSELADIVWHELMNGSNSPWQCINLSIVAFIYDVKEDVLYRDVEDILNKKINTK